MWLCYRITVLKLWKRFDGFPCEFKCWGWVSNLHVMNWATEVRATCDEFRSSVSWSSFWWVNKYSDIISRWIWTCKPFDYQREVQSTFWNSLKSTNCYCTHKCCTLQILTFELCNHITFLLDIMNFDLCTQWCLEFELCTHKILNYRVCKTLSLSLHPWNIKLYRFAPLKSWIYSVVPNTHHKLNFNALQFAPL